MVAVRHARSLAVIAGVTGALVMLVSPARAHAAGLGSGIYNLAPVASAVIDPSLKWNPGNDSWKWNGDPKRHHGDSKDVPEPGTLGLYLSALLGGAFYLRSRKSRSL